MLRVPVASVVQLTCANGGAASRPITPYKSRMPISPAGDRLSHETLRKIFGFAATSLVFLLCVWVVDRNTQRLHASSQTVAHSYQVGNALESMLSTLKDAESAQRGYTITGDEAFLQPYAAATIRVWRNFESLQTLTADNSVQQARLVDVRTRLVTKLAEMDSVVRVRRVNPDEASALVRSGRGKRFMDSLTATVATMQKEEQRLMALRTEQNDGVVRQSAMVAILAGLLSVGIVVLLYRFVRRSERLQEQSAETIAAQREQLQITLTSIGDGVIATDAQGNVTYLNAVAQELTGWTTETAAGKPLTEIFSIVNESTRLPVENPALRALREGRIVGLANHTILLSRDGAERPIDDSAAPIRAKDGSITGCVLVFRDISDRYAAERREREAQQEMAATLESITDAFLRIDGDWRVRYLNAEAERLTRLPASDTLGEPFWELFPDLKHTPLEKNLRECAASGAARDFEHHSERWDRWYAVRCYPGRNGGVSMHLRDTTAARRATQALRASEDDLDFALASADLGHWSFNLRDGSSRRTPRHDEIFGFDAQRDWTYEVFLEHVHPTERDAVDRAFQQAVATDGIWDIQCTIRRGDGVERQIWKTARIKRGSDGRIEKMLGIVGDVTEQRQVETERTRAELALRDADRRKDEFLATLAHELRNPLAPIRNGLEIIRIAGENPTIVERTRVMMDRQMNQMVRLVDDLLDVSRVTSGKLELQRERFEMHLMVDIAIETSRPLIDAAGLTLSVLMSNEPIIMQGDVTRLAQVISNLLSNSSRYTPRGGRIVLRVEREPGVVVVSVTDDGIGIPQPMLESIFGMFTQVDRRLEKVSGGLGLGLSLVKAIVEGHGGTAEARSDGEGHGSEFVIRLPLESGE